MTTAPVLVMAGLASVALLAWKRPARATSSTRSPERTTADRKAAHDAMIALISREAQAVGLDPRVAVAFADRESGLDPYAQGDKRWPLKNDGEQYRRHVLENSRLSRNPYRLDPALWHAYGLFQLLAPFHVLEHEDPRALLDPLTNTQRGVRAVRSVLEKAQGNLYDARRRYVGCGPESACAASELQRIDQAWTETLRKWGLS